MQRLRLLAIVIWCIAPLNLTTAQESDESVRLVGPARLAGTGRYRPGEWGMVSVRLANTSDRDQTTQTVSFFDQFRMTQFSSETLVPAHSMRTVSHPIYVPADVDDGVDRLDLLTTIVEDSSTGEVLKRQRSGDLLPSHFVPLMKIKPTCAMLAIDGQHDTHIYEAVIAVRTAHGLDRRVGMLVECPLPASPLAYSGTEQLIVVDDSLSGDSAAASTIRQWLLDGGHLWVFLESVAQQTLRQLLGNSCRVEYVDQITLPEVTIVPTSRLAPTAAMREFEEPVPLVRVLVDDLKVTHTVNGWPAAFQQRVGHGRIMYLALGAKGWIRHRSPTDSQPRDPSMSSNFVPTQSLDDATEEFMQPPAARSLSIDHFRPYLYDRVGHRIAERRPVIAVLTLFCLSLLASGMWLHRQGRLERLLWIVPSVSVMAVGILGTMGMQSRQDMHDTVSVLQFIDMDPEQDELNVNGLAALYQQNKGDATLRGTASGNILPERFDRESDIRRQVWTSNGPWYWQRLPLDAGLRFAPFHFGVTPQARARITGSFGPDGFRGKFESGPFQNVSDLLVATPAQYTLALTMPDDGRVAGGQSDVQEPGHYISAALLSNEQRRRQEVIRQMLAATVRQDKYPDQPTLIAWADPLDTGLEFADHVSQVGSALLTLPLEWERPEPGTRVTIPAPFLPYESVSNTKVGITTAFDRRSGLWRSTTFAKSALLRFQVPDVVLPLQAETVTLTLDVSAASRTLDIATGLPDEMIQVARLDGPLGVYTFQIDNPQGLRVDDRGGLHVLLDVSDVTFDKGVDVQVSDQQEGWLIHALQMELNGHTQAADSDL